MKTQKNNDSIDKRMYIVTIISVLIAALTFLFGSGVISQLERSNEHTSIVDEESVPSEQNTEEPNTTGSPVNIGDHTDVSGDIQEINSPDIYIESVILADDGFYYEYPGTNEFINMEKLVLIGIFTYTKEMNEEEKKNWSHGGELLNSDGEICYSDRTGFWSDYESCQFAIDLPEEIESGQYTCNIYHYINDRQLSVTIQFEIY